MKSGLHLDESALSKPELTRAALVVNRAFFDDPFFRSLLPNDRLRERGLTIFFRANLVHLGEGARVVTVRSDDAIQGVAAWQRGYPLTAAHGPFARS